MKKLLFLLVVILMGTTSRAQTYHFDVNNDGEIELTDALLIINYILGRFNPGDNNQPQFYLSCPDDHHPHLIDLGLPSGTKWACCNVDTDHPENQSPTNYGGYYAWGETETKTTYDWSSYIHCDRSSSTYHDLGSDIAGTEYDVAHVKWGGSWVIPSEEQQDELVYNCPPEWTTVNGVNGGRFTSKKNGASIFLPAAGSLHGTDFYDAGSGGYYWSSTQRPADASSVISLTFNRGYTSQYYDSRTYGLSVRPVVRPLALSSTSLDLNVGEEGTISVTSGNGRYSAESSDTYVATAVVDGTSVKVTAVGAGTANITVTDRRSGETASIEVTVTAPSSSLCPDGNHPHMIDLGLPSGTKWACCNVDTENPNNQHPTNLGGYYSWGETEEKDIYNSSTYLYRDFSSDNLTYLYLGESICGTQYDVAYTKWGDDWQMPSRLQSKELVSSCTYFWTYENGVLGGKFVSNYNGNCIFLPASGYRYDSTLKDHGGGGYYWVGTYFRDINVYLLGFASVNANGNNSVMQRGDGCTVRPVSR